MNDDLKLRFIEEYKINDLNFEQKSGQIFRSVAKYEEIVGKDCFDFSVDDIIGYYKYKLSSSVTYLQVVNYVLLNYTNWAIKQTLNKDGQNHYVEITREILSSCVDKQITDSLIVTRDELLCELRKFDVARDACFCLAFFEGFKQDEICQLKIKDIDPATNIAVTCRGRHLKISNELYAYMLKANEETEITIITKAEKETNIKLEGNTIIKWSPRRSESTPNYARKITKRLSKLFIDTQLNWLSFPCLKESGRLDYIINLYYTDGATDLRECIVTHQDEITYRYGKILSIKNYVNDYEKYI